MTTDYEMLVKHKENKQLMAVLIMEKYKPLIRKRSKMFSSITRHEIDAEDIASESYFKLLKFLDWINPEKANPDKFTFTYFVKSSVKRSYLKLEKRTLRTSSIHDEKFVEPIHCDNSYSRIEQSCDRETNKKGSFINCLTKRQISILNHVKTGKDIKEISTLLNETTRLVTREIRAMRRAYVSFSN